MLRRTDKERLLKLQSEPSEIELTQAPAKMDITGKNPNADKKPMLSMPLSDHHFKQPQNDQGKVTIMEPYCAYTEDFIREQVLGEIISDIEPVERKVFLNAGSIGEIASGGEAACDSVQGSGVGNVQPPPGIMDELEQYEPFVAYTLDYIADLEQGNSTPDKPDENQPEKRDPGGGEAGVSNTSVPDAQKLSVKLGQLELADGDVFLTKDY